jgi:hypothetical protein
MKILPQQEYHIRQVIRDNLALDPLISIRNLKKAVEYNTHRPIGDKYLMRLLGKIRGEVIVRADRQKLTERLTEVKERFRVLRMELYRIVYWEMRYFPEFGIQRPTNQERMNAVKTLAQMDLALLKTELDVGEFRKKQNDIEALLNDPALPSELHEQIIGVFRQWKFSKPEQGEVKEATEIATTKN